MATKTETVDAASSGAELLLEDKGFREFVREMENREAAAAAERRDNYGEGVLVAAWEKLHGVAEEPKAAPVRPTTTSDMAAPEIGRQERASEAESLDRCPNCGSLLLHDTDVIRCSAERCRYARLANTGWEEATATSGDQPRPVSELTTGDTACPMPRLRIKRASDVEPETVEWLWHPRIPLGKVTILTGDPSDGKSTITCELAARVTKGESLPGDDRLPVPADALIISAEDGLADTIRPRLDAAGADVGRVNLVESVQSRSGNPEHLNLNNEEHLKAIEAAIQYSPALVVVDPLSAYLGSLDTWNDSKARSVLAPLAKIAEHHGCAIVCIVHLNKSGDGRRALYRVMGSVAFTAQARSVLFVGSDPEQPETRVLAHIKSNLTERAPSLDYRLVGHTITAKDGSTIETVAVEWGKASELTAERMLAGSDAEGPTAREDAEDFIRGMLGAGRVPATAVLEAWGAEGHKSPTTLRRAAKDLKVQHPRDGFGPGSTLYWELPA